MTLAASARPRILFETGLPPRYHLPLSGVRFDLPRPSATRTEYPYKGTVAYWSVVTAGQFRSDILHTLQSCSDCKSFLYCQLVNQSGESLRDRKKRRTRAALERATLRLSAEKGYDHVTVEEIAAEADVSVRTFFNYFASKDDALIGADPESGPRIAARVLAAQGTPFEAFRAAVLAEIDDELNNARDLWLLRKDVLMQRSDLLVRAFASNAEAEQQLGAAVAERAGLPADHLYPRLMVAAVTAAFRCALSRWANDDSVALGDLVGEALDLLGAGLAHAPHHHEGGPS